jgi:hypothetical protein
MNKTYYFEARVLTRTGLTVVARLNFKEYQEGIKTKKAQISLNSTTESIRRLRKLF